MRSFGGVQPVDRSNLGTGVGKTLRVVVTDSSHAIGGPALSFYSQVGSIDGVSIQPLPPLP